MVAELYSPDRSTFVAWVMVIGIFAVVAWLDRAVGATLFRNRRLARWPMRIALAIAGGFLPVIISQLESRFAEEEFFVALQGAILVGFCLLLLTAQAHFLRVGDPAKAINSRTRQSSLAIAGIAATTVVGVGVWGMAAYQDSFFTPVTPRYPGLTETSPFLCGQVPPDPRRPAGQEVYQQLLARIEANPHKGVPELGMLALGTGQAHWAESFRDAILGEARAGQFTGPANSVKSTQHAAVLRAYYAPRVRDAFPALFSTSEWEMLRAWFAAINRRALTTEWVDWMYALAFSKWPTGPYENQETGAGLLAILEAEGLSSPDLSPINQAYLERNRRGWTQRFRNTDDAFYYQPEWITNAYFQSLYWQTKTDLEPNVINRRLSFEWMLLQALPDGAPPNYNHPYYQLPAGTAYLAARLERDPRFIWWTARMLDWAEKTGALLWAQPGVENAVHLQGVSPTIGSCLVYGNSGLPNRPGPLAPDKIVLRDGWTIDATYMLLNLRFSGWHRYKATNDVVLLYQGGPIVVEKGGGDSLRWLPAGRSLFRDKRMPRENLNGLITPRTGWSQVVHRLTRIGSRWAQDPPPYAQVESVDWLGPVDVSRTVIDNWRGWKHTRTVYFVHEGPVIVIDSAHGKGEAAIIWHLVGEGRQDGNSFWLRDAPWPARMILAPETWRDTAVQPTGIGPQEAGVGAPNWDVRISASVPGRLYVATVFGLGPWASANYEIRELASGQLITAMRKDASLSLLQNDSAQWLQTDNLGTDGQWLLAMRSDDKHVVCFAHGAHAQIRMKDRPRELRDAEGNIWPSWEWREGLLSTRNIDLNRAICLNVVEKSP